MKKIKKYNYTTIQNLKNFENKFKPNKKNIYEREYKEGNKYIYFLRNIKYKLNSFNNNWKKLKNHKDSVYHLSKLNDGRLISCSWW